MAWLGKTAEALVTKLKVRLSLGSISCLRLMIAQPFQTCQSGLHVRRSILFYRFWHGRDRVEKRREETYKSTLGGYSGIDNAIDC